MYVYLQPGSHYRRPICLIASPILAIGLVGCVSFETSSKQTKDGAPRAPIAWGIMNDAKGCVIFREYSKSTLGFFVVAAGVSSHGELEVVETDGYTLSKPVWLEDQDSMNELQRLANQDKIRYVKVQAKYTPGELEAARALCRKKNAWE
ncbi:MAG TPA: hypothetical protein VGY49_02620 [Burkholderiaceae bacterium]|jgi:hypothetical protein|nr:hypothetical protein [Burkholderiaceae bacterium]